MPTYEYFCPDCSVKFEKMRPVKERDDEALCPNCNCDCDRVISGFSFYSAEPQGSFVRKQDEAKEKMWRSERKIEDQKIKDPDPLARWRKEREQTCGRGPEAWVEWAQEEKTRKEKEAEFEHNKQEAVKEYSKWASKSTSSDPDEREYYKEAIKQERFAEAVQGWDEDFQLKSKLDMEKLEEKKKPTYPTWGSKKTKKSKPKKQDQPEDS
jgi:putative FmdB family regulatory protein